MKIIVLLCALAAAVSAEKKAPYPPSGWKPDGPQFTYPPPMPSNEYGPASTPAPTEPPTEPPQEPPATYIPSEQSSESPNGYQRYQSQRFTSQSSAQFNQGAGQFFIITPQGQLQHIPIIPPQMRNKDAEDVEPQQDDRNQNFGRFMQRTPSSEENQQKQRANESRPKSRQFQASSGQQVSFTPDGRVDNAKQSQSQQTSAKITAQSGTQQPTQFIAFIPAVPLGRVQAASMVQGEMPQNGQYHVIYPNGKLQRVQYMNLIGPNNRLTANVQYQEVDPIRGPLYTFGSPLVRVL